ncbi:MAG: class I SAM-dependent methyltransferase [Chloroflexota bacterium]|nr:class I SAM-dependent methyltransferase [Anaerolineae bacterium]
MTTQPQTADLAAVKAKQQQAWSTGDYAIVGASLLIVSEQLCEAADLHSGHKVLDVATGSGNTALAAARRWCEVTGIDYVPALLKHANDRATAEQLHVTFKEGDAENIPCTDESFDVVMSTFGVMFAPNQEQAASEMLRVCRPEGLIAMANWVPDGCVGEIFRVIAKYIPPAPGLKPAALWATQDRLTELFGSQTNNIQLTRRSYYFRYRSAQHWVDTFSTYYGPIVKAFGALDTDGKKSLSADLVDILNRHNRAGNDALVSQADYAEIVITKK